VKRKEKGKRTRGRELGWLAGWAALPRAGPVGLVAFSSYIFFVLSFHSFLISYFLYRFCKTPSNKFKLLSEVL
jgi:hypothetical protein